MSKKKHEVGRTITTPSPYGSHTSMVVNHEKYNMALSEDEVLCKDDYRFYITKKSRLDNGMADPARYSSKMKDMPDAEI